jgi:hypothetical protein
MTGIILAIVLLAVLAVLVVAAGKPDEFRVTRSALINAAPADIFPHVDDLHKWQAWSPWARLDPDAKSEFSGPEAGVGASTSWVGKKTGEGTMTCMVSRPAEFIQFRLEFRKPMQSVSTAEFTFRPESGGKTLVTWTMYGPNSFMGKIMSLFMSCEKMVGGQFDQGLGNLRETVEGK